MNSDAIRNMSRLGEMPSNNLNHDRSVEE